ncbi:hypothetical protein L218DRAFT_913104 [Marasmius fiardii PR-910]|nr:hypothetical protein L218DRAFT_913104 [Marasmius fiardii PR-910]
MRRNDITRAEFFWEFKWRERDDGFDDGAGEVSDDEEEAKEAEDVFDEEVVDGESGGNGEEGEEEEDIDMERDGDEQLGAEKEQDTAPPFEKERKDSGDTRNQMATYAGAILCSQFRTHLFSIQVTRTRARLLRWDREGAVVTSSFVFAEEPYLVETSLSRMNNPTRHRSRSMGERLCSRAMHAPLGDLRAGFLSSMRSAKTKHTSKTHGGSRSRVCRRKVMSIRC